MTNYHVTDDGDKVCVAPSLDKCRGKLKGEKSPHFDSKEAAETFYKEYIEAKNDKFVSLSKSRNKNRTSSRNSEKSSESTLVNVTDSIDSLDENDLTEYASSSPEACEKVGQLVQQRLRARRWEADTLKALTPGSGSPVSSKTYSLLSEEVRLQQKKTAHMLDAHMSSPHYRPVTTPASTDSLDPENSVGNFPDKVSCVWQRKLLDDYARNNGPTPVYHLEGSKLSPAGGLVGFSKTEDGAINETIEAYPAANADEWNAGVPHRVADDAITRAKAQGAKRVRILVLIDGYDKRDFTLET